MIGLTIGGAASAQTLDVRQWQGQTAATRQPEHVVARTQAEWRSLWMRVGSRAPDLFEPGRMHAVGIFLGARGEGHGLNLISTSRRRDRIVVVFEERVPPPVGEALLAQRSPASPPRPVSSAPMPSGTASFAGNGPGAPPAPASPVPATTTASRAAPSQPLTSPWAIVLINRVDLPISVEQRMYR